MFFPVTIMGSKCDLQRVTSKCQGLANIFGVESAKILNKIHRTQILEATECSGSTGDMGSLWREKGLVLKGRSTAQMLCDFGQAPILSELPDQLSVKCSK